MNVLKGTIRLLLIMASCRFVFTWDMEILLRNIITSHRVMQTHEINWFITEHLDSESSEHFQEFLNTIHRESMTTQMVLTNNSDIRFIETTSKRYYLAIVMTTGAEDPIMRIHDNVLRGRHTYMNFIVLVKPLKDFAVAERLLSSLHRNNFQNSFLYVSFLNGSSEFLGFSFYPKFSINSRPNLLTELEENYKKIVSTSLDCRGFEFYTPFGLDLPGVFYYVSKHNTIEKQGIAFRTLDLFTQHINASLEPYPTANGSLDNTVVSMKETLDLIRSKKILITAHAYALFNTDDEIEKSYSLLLVRWCLMVPIRNTVSTFYYPIEPFDVYVWYMILIAFLTLAIIDGLIIVWESRFKLRRNLVSQVQASVVDNLGYILNITASKNIKQPSRIKFLLYACVFFHAFFISASYTSLLGSILTVTLFREKINTLDDLIRANISTMIIDYELEFLLSQNLDLPPEFLNLIIPVDPATFHRHQSTLNQSYAYFVTDDKWKFLRCQQTSLKPGLFKFTDICFGTFHWSYPMEMDSPIWRNLEYFILRVHSSGLLFYFEKIAFQHAIHAGYMQRFKSHKDYQAAGLTHMSMVFIMLLMAGILGIFILLGECLYYRLNKN